MESQNTTDDANPPVSDAGARMLAVSYEKEAAEKRFGLPFNAFCGWPDEDPPAVRDVQEGAAPAH